MMMSTRSNALESWSLTLLLLLFISCYFVAVDAAAGTTNTNTTTTKSFKKLFKPTTTTSTTTWKKQQQQQKQKQITTMTSQQQQTHHHHHHHHHLVGEISAVYDLLDRILNHHKHFFVLKIVNNNLTSSSSSLVVEEDDNNNNKNNNSNSNDDDDNYNNNNNNNNDNDNKRLYFRLEDYDDDDENDATDDDDDDEDEDDYNNKILITASTVSELTAGIGYYLWNYCNITIGWKRGGGSSNIKLPLKWPKIGHKNGITKYRSVPWSYFMNVCTHSYSLVWYDKRDWEDYIDWLSLNGINNIVALTGQEQIQYDTFRQLGLQDEDIRTWFNGPAFLTWSRGQNEYGNNIAGPLPKSWMKQQYELQKNFILPRLRSLGIIGQLPGFQGNVPIQIKTLYKDNNITQQGQTGWIDSLDPLFGKISDLYMKNLLGAFGTDHWYQLDGYFNGGTAPWMSSRRNTTMISSSSSSSSSNDSNSTGSSQQQHNDDDNTSYNTISSLLSSSSSTSHDKNWFLRGKAAYEGLNRTDPNAIWSFQGFSLIFWDDTQEKANAIKGFIDAVPSNKFVILDMSYSGLGEWTKWNNSSFFGTPFIWTALHDFGGTDGIKGDIRRLNHIPFDLLNGTSVVGIGGTPEGIDQNPAYYEFLFGSTFRSNSIQDLEDFMAQRSIKRYGLKSHNDDNHDSSTAAYHASKAWSLLTRSLYSNDINVQDHTGIAHVNPRGSALFFESDRYTPKPIMCQVFHAWEHLLLAAQEAEKGSSNVIFSNNKPFRYDLVNLGREVLAQLSTPAALNFTNATGREPLDPSELLSTGKFYTDLLNDTDTLVATDIAFLLGPWIESAKKWGSDSDYNTYDDCFSSILNNTDCVQFYEWNARCQITTWNPTPKDSPSIPGGPIDYAAKHWSGLINDYYRRRVGIILGRALQDQASGNPLNTTVVDRLLADHAYTWTTSRNRYPTRISGNALKVSQTMYHKYKHWFNTCQTGEDDEGNYELKEK